VDEIARIRAAYEARAASIPADLYAWHRPEIQYWQARTARVCTSLLRAASAFPLHTKSIADIGCGQGNWLLEFLQWGATPANLHGVDLLDERIAIARQRLPDADIQCGDARRLPWADGSFDLVTQFTVFSSIQNQEMHAAIAAEMVRVLRPGGHILWYDCRYSNPSRATVTGVNRKEIQRLFPNCGIRFATATLLPPLSRAIARYSWTAAAALESLRFTRTHLAALITPASLK
jgi:ubiquinone/menaquinone biosynthesis C-methylase UbiE